MAEENISENILLRFVAVGIDDCLDCKSELVTFSQVDNVHLLLYTLDKSDGAESSAQMTATPVGQALRLLCDSKFNNADSLLQLPQLTIGKGKVSMIFTMRRPAGGMANGSDTEEELDLSPSTSKQAAERRQQAEERRKLKSMNKHTVHVVRRFDDVHALDRVELQINSGSWQTMSIGEFHSTYFVQPQHELELLHSQQQNCAKDWLKVIQADAGSYKSFRDNGNPFDTFAKIVERQGGEQTELLQKLTTNCLAVNEVTRLAERRFVLSIFNRVRVIFEFITINEYTVWFFVPRLNRYTTMNNVSVEDFDLCNVRTCIKLTRDKSDFFWHQADHNIRDILLVAFQLALAQVGRQSVLFLGQLDKLSRFLCMQYIMASFMNSPNCQDDHSEKWICARYLQRIMEVSETLGVVVVIEYPGIVTLLPENRQVIRCIQKRDPNSGTIAWSVFEDVTEKDEYGIQQIIDAVNF